MDNFSKIKDQLLGDQYYDGGEKQPTSGVKKKKDGKKKKTLKHRWDKLSKNFSELYWNFIWQEEEDLYDTVFETTCIGFYPR